MLKRFLCLLSLGFVLLMTSCAAGMGSYDYYNGDAALDENGEAYIEIDERGYQDPKNNPLSSFSLDSSSYAYSNIRRLINNNSYISKDAVVIEEMLNYFNYSYENNTENALATTLELARCPYNEKNHLALISVNSKDIEKDNVKTDDLVDNKKTDSIYDGVSNDDLADNGMESFFGNVKSFLNSIGYVPEFFTKIFSFLPDWCLTFVGFGFTIIVAISVNKMVRG